MKRPEYVHCVRTGLWTKPEDEGGQPETKAWCGRDTDREWAFVDAGHASLVARKKGMHLVCPECFKAIVEALKTQTWESV